MTAHATTRAVCNSSNGGMPRVNNCRQGSYFGVSPWQSRDDFGEPSSGAGQTTSIAGDAGDQPASSLRFRAATVAETKDGADCVLFVDQRGNVIGIFTDGVGDGEGDGEGDGGKPALRRITGRFLEVAAEGYQEYLDCSRDPSWDVLLLCLSQSDRIAGTGEEQETGVDDSHLYVLAEAQGGDSLRISAPADLTGEEQAGVAGCVGPVTLATGFRLDFQCRHLINAEIGDDGLVKRQLGEALRLTRLPVDLVQKLLPGKSFVNVGSLAIAHIR